MDKTKKQKAAKVLDQSEIDEVVEKITGRPATDAKKTKKSSEVLSQEEINRLLEAITNCDENYYPMTANTRKVKIYDFKRPDVFSKQEIRDISCIAENIARALNKFITSEYDISVNVHVCSVDQLMCEEFVRSVPTPAPCCSFEWMEGRGLFEMDPAVFYYCFLGASSVKKNHEPNGLEKQIFETDKLAGLPLDVYKNGKYVGSGESLVIDNENAAVRIVTKPESLEQKTDNGFYNTKVIFGSRITDENFKFDEGTILELNENIADPVRIVKDEKTIGWGELVVIDESFGVKVLEVIR